MTQPKEIARQSLNYMLNTETLPIIAAHRIVGRMADESFTGTGENEGRELLLRVGHHLCLQVAAVMA